MKSIKIFFLISIILPMLSVPLSKVYGQQDWHRWNTKEFSYLIEKESSSVRIDDDKVSANIILLSFKNIYNFFISDLDGDNCPFTPSCSNFFVEAISETNLFIGVLLFADRFLRDSNPFKSHQHYPIIRNKKFYDPVRKYLP